MGPHVVGLLEYTVILAVGAGVFNLGLKTGVTYLKPVFLILGGGVSLVGMLGVLVNLLELLTV